MINYSELTVIIPAFNEAQTISEVCRKVKAVSPEIAIIVVDDHSADGTSDAARQVKGVDVQRHVHNRGNGACVKSGIRAAKTPYVMVIDADGQHDPKDIPRFCELLPDYDLVVGSRDGNTRSHPVRKFGNWFMKKLAGYLIGVEIPDLTSGYRLFKRENILEFMHLYPNGFSFPTTSTIAFLVSGYYVSFIPLTMHERLKGTQSKIRIYQDGIKFIRIILRIVAMFKPMKIFVPLSELLIMIGLLYVLFTYLWLSPGQLIIPGGAIILMVSGIVIFCFGIVLAQIAELRLHLRH